MSLVRGILLSLALLAGGACQSPGTIVIEASEPCAGDRGEPVDVDVYFMLGGDCPVDLCAPFNCPANRCEHSCTGDCSYQDLADGIDQLDPSPGTYAVILDFAYDDGTYGLSCAAEVTFDADGTSSDVIQPEAMACCP